MKFVVASLSIVIAALPFQATASLMGPNLPSYTYSMPSIPNILPDTCIPVGVSEYCITFTNSSTQALSSILSGNNQLGQMMQQGLAQAPIGSIASLATQAGINAQIQQLAGSTSPTQIANAIAQAIIANHAQATSDQQALNTAMQTNGTGQLAATQIQAEMIQNLTAKIEQQNALLSAQQTQNQTQINNAYSQAGTELDLTGPATSGWLI